MKAKLLGFYWEKAKGVSIDEVASALQKIAHKEIEYQEYKRLMYLDTIDGYHAGVFLTSKDRNKAPTVSQGDDGKWSVKVTDLGQPIVDFNFFVISSATGRGLYQHYHHSCGVGQFTGFCKQFHDLIRNEKRKSELAAAGKDATQKPVKPINAKYRNTLKFGYLLQEGDLKSLVARFDRIKAFQCEYMAVLPGASKFKPLQSRARSYIHRFAFSKGSKNAIITDIMQAVEGLGLTKGSVLCSDDDGRDQSVDIFENPSNFGEFDVDQIATDDTLNVSDIVKSTFLKKMLAIAKRTPQITQVAEE